MALTLDRTDQSLFGRWWWTVDRVTLVMLMSLMLIGAILVAAASPAVAVRIHVEPFYFISRQYIFLALSLLVIFGVSLLPPQQVKRLAVIGFLGSLFLMLLLPFFGVEIKGARRWLSLFGMSIQPSEFLKPCFAVVTAWILSERHRLVGFPGFKISAALYGIVAFLLIIQPDFGMLVTVSAMWGIQFFLAGLPIFWLLLMGAGGTFGLWLAYTLVPHVHSRVERFLDPSSGDNYQIMKSLEAFGSGGLFGRGPGEGLVKQSIPDSHTDLIFAVAGEEFGAIACLIIIMIFAAVIVRGMRRIWGENDLFVMIAVTGLLAQFGIQAIINMGVAVKLLPAKGMTLPFLSYGGSSLLAIAIGMGMMLALTRRRFSGALPRKKSKARA